MRGATSQHTANTAACRTASESEYSHLRRTLHRPAAPLVCLASAQPAAATTVLEHSNIPYYNSYPLDLSEPVYNNSPPVPESIAPLSRRATVETVLDENASVPQRYSQPSQPHLYAGATFGAARTEFDFIRDEQVLRGGEIWGPFESEEDWDLAKWLIKMLDIPKQMSC